jgi:alkanesulfonate monooxygenase SsuD/methylene tetrahydromethanopterin reductase-like flavin-dependent oxidoreductase (luciferase family)
MDFGIFYEIQVNSPLKHREREAEVFHQVLDQVVAAEEAGFNNFWSVEHHFQPGFSHSSAPEVLYGALSQRTSRIRIGHAVVLLPFPYNHPVRVAERIATLDILSKGRVEVGTGRSGTIQELGGFGIPPEETRPRWEEALRLLVNIWTSKDGTFSWKGKYFDIPERSIVPLPVQKPHPPLWLACSNEETHKIAGRMGLGLLTLVVMVGPEEVARRINLYRDGLKEVKPVGAFVNNRTAVFYMVHCADTDKEARENAERGFMSYVNTIFTVSGQLQAAVKEGTRDAPARAGANLPPGVSAQEVNMDYLLRNRTVICGSPDTCIEQLEHIQKVTGLDHMMGMQQFWSIPHEKVMKSIRLFGKHVIPHFARQNGAARAGASH